MSQRDRDRLVVVRQVVGEMMRVVHAAQVLGLKGRQVYRIVDHFRRRVTRE